MSRVEELTSHTHTHTHTYPPLPAKGTQWRQCKCIKQGLPPLKVCPCTTIYMYLTTVGRNKRCMCCNLYGVVLTVVQRILLCE